ncbi:hypothetical protein O6H91_07G089600 [Diphasiastrum complanatum]|uniref:Uncharacterized protein n=1 Tax=Diphasiastrum complanatum TaxID=34168 RepID=A0ACC2D7R1_DIPCM|nr:hypothetical protein O6H91_07G089600 [Diphasiastrum complanatum]
MLNMDMMNFFSPHGVVSYCYYFFEFLLKVRTPRQCDNVNIVNTTNDHDQPHATYGDIELYSFGGFQHSLTCSDIPFGTFIAFVERIVKTCPLKLVIQCIRANTWNMSSTPSKSAMSWLERMGVCSILNHIWG